MKKHLAQSCAREEFNLLEKQVESFDTDNALKSLKAIASALKVEF